MFYAHMQHFHCLVCDTNMILNNMYCLDGKSSLTSTPSAQINPEDKMSRDD